MSKQKKILIAEYNKDNRTILCKMLKNIGHEVFEAQDGVEVIAKTSSLMPDLILLDILMPQKDGCTVCKELKNNIKTKEIPIIVITGLEDNESKIKCLEAGANDFLTKPYDNSELKLRVSNTLQVKEYNDLLKLTTSKLEHDIEIKDKNLKKAFQMLELSNKLLHDGYMDTIERLVAVSEYKDQKNVSHITRIGLFSELFGKEIGFTNDEADTILYASPLHDIGKVGIPSQILLKPGDLSEAEFNLMKNHTTIGADLLKGAKSKYLQMAHDIALTHHEKYDGSGYPRGLKEDDIPIEGRIVKLADTYDALRSLRPYKAPFAHKEVLEIISKGNERVMPKHFDPVLLEAFTDNHKKFDEIYNSLNDHNN